jgi:hypothetical protein
MCASNGASRRRAALMSPTRTKIVGTPLPRLDPYM